MNFRLGKARCTVVQMRLIGLLKLKTVASGQIFITSAQISRMGGMMRSEWNSPPGPPFSPYTCRTPYCCGMRQSCSQSVKAIADLDRADDEIGALEGLGPVRGGRDAERQLVLLR